MEHDVEATLERARTQIAALAATPRACSSTSAPPVR
jgi:hypothetical protein